MRHNINQDQQQTNNINPVTKKIKERAIPKQYAGKTVQLSKRKLFTLKSLSATRMAQRGTRGMPVLGRGSSVQSLGSFALQVVAWQSLIWDLGAQSVAHKTHEKKKKRTYVHVSGICM